MAKIYGVGLLVVVAVSTLYPFVFLSQRDQLHLKGWYNSFGPFSQLILYACARVASYPYLVDLQHAVSNSLNTVAACMVVALGELAGGTMQGFLFEYDSEVHATFTCLRFCPGQVIHSCSSATSVSEDSSTCAVKNLTALKRRIGKSHISRAVLLQHSPGPIVSSEGKQGKSHIHVSVQTQSHAILYPCAYELLPSADSIRHCVRCGSL